jgi:hypothetical protein
MVYVGGPDLMGSGVFGGNSSSVSPPIRENTSPTFYSKKEPFSEKTSRRFRKTLAVMLITFGTFMVGNSFYNAYETHVKNKPVSEKGALSKNSTYVGALSYLLAMSVTPKKKTN